MTGCILALEGLDGVGKTTAARRVADACGGVLLSTPDASLGCVRSALDALYRSSPDAAHLFYASSVAYASEVARRERAQGKVVIIDRYWLSTWAYAPMRPTGLDLSEVEAGLCAADWTVLLTLDEAERSRRLRARGMSAADRRTLDAGTAAALEQRYLDGLRRPVAGNGIVLDIAGRTPESCAGALIELVTRTVTGSSGRRGER
jgi:dTMP kinase